MINSSQKDPLLRLPPSVTTLRPRAPRPQSAAVPLKVWLSPLGSVVRARPVRAQPPGARAAPQSESKRAVLFT